jgi:hypothetical protein
MATATAAGGSGGACAKAVGRSGMASSGSVRYEAVVNVDAYPGHTPVLSFASWMVCTRCGTVGAEVRPNWREHHAQGAG